MTTIKANLAIKCATYRWSNDGRKSCLYEPPITRKPRRYQVYEGLASDFSATQIPLMCRRLWLSRSLGEARTIPYNLSR